MPGAPAAGVNMQNNSNAFQSHQSMGGSSPSNGSSSMGLSTPSRQGQPLAPSVVISPSAPPVSISFTTSY
jgi:hypothetical protein